eukprot:gene26622-12639_t
MFQTELTGTVRKWGREACDQSAQSGNDDADPNLNNDDDNPANITPIDNAKAGRPIFCQSYGPGDTAYPSADADFANVAAKKVGVSFVVDNIPIDSVSPSEAANFNR